MNETAPSPQLMGGRNYYSTNQAAVILGMKPNTLLQILVRFRGLRPKRKFNNSYLWTNAEIEAVAASRK